MIIICIFFVDFARTCWTLDDFSASPLTGGGEAVCSGRPDVRRVPGRALRRQVRPVFLCQRHLPAVLLRVLLGQHPLPGRPWVPQAAGEGGRRPPSTRLLPLELRAAGQRGITDLHYPQPRWRRTNENSSHRLHPTSEKKRNRSDSRFWTRCQSFVGGEETPPAYNLHFGTKSHYNAHTYTRTHTQDGSVCPPSGPLTYLKIHIALFFCFVVI